MMLLLCVLTMTVQTAWADNVTYIDANGNEQTVDATPLAFKNGSYWYLTTSTLNAGQWYYVNSDNIISDSRRITVSGSGAANIILCDGKIFSYGSRGITGNITIYGQSAGTGKMEIYGQNNYTDMETQYDNAIDGDITIYGGNVEVEGGSGYEESEAVIYPRGAIGGTVNLYGGSLKATGTDAEADYGELGDSNFYFINSTNGITGTVNFYGGTLNARGGNHDSAYKIDDGNYDSNGISGDVNLSWTWGSDSFYANSINGTVTIAADKPFKDEQGNSHTAANVGDINGHTLTPVIPAFANSGDGSAEHPYTIYEANGWNAFCDALQHNDTWNRFTGKTVKLGANISVTQSAGGEGHEFMGTFDGDGKTLNVNITDTENQGTAPFRFISNATIRNLHVTGSVTGTAHASGLVGKACAGTILIENCLIEANVNSTVGDTNGNKHCGGIVGHGFGGSSPVSLTLRNCVYAGTITCDKNYIGGLQGWSDGNTLTLENCLFAGNYQGTATGTAAFHPIALHNTGRTTNLTATNVFAAVAPTATNANFIAANGTKATGRTTAPASLGNQVATYSYMNMTVYEHGLYYNGLYYVAPTLSTDSDNAYLINNEDDWTNFCDALYDNGTWNRFSGQTVKLGNDISVSRMAGYDNHDFLGTFDGNHKRLTFTATATANYLAPFRNVLGNSSSDHAVIRDLNVVTNITSADYRHTAGLIAEVWGYVDVVNCNVTVDITANKGTTNTDLYPAGLASQVVSGAQLTVSGCTVGGTIATNGKYAGGIIGIVQGSASITNSACGVTINSSTEGDGTHGGLVAVQGNYDGSSISITGCVFNGSLLGESTPSCGGFVGWRSQTVNISNSLYAPAEVSINTTDGSTPCATFVRNGDSNTNITNCYYTATLGTVQGTKVYSISKGENVTTLEINGTATQSYDVSGLSFYNTGLKCGDVLYAVENAQLSLTLANNATGAPLGYQYSGYAASGGATLDGTTLTMADADVIVSLNTDLLSTGQPVSVTYMNADGTTSSHDAIALDETMTTLAGGWYFVGKDIAYTGTITLNGDVTIILADGKTMSVGTSETPISGGAISGEIYINWREYYDYALTVYGQSLANSTAGTLSLHTSSYGIEVKAYTQHSGNVSITSVYNSGIWTLGDAVTINGGHLDVNVGNVALFSYSDVIINGGIVNATGQNGGIQSSNNGNITLGWTNTSDYIYVNSYETTSTIAIASGQAFIDENNVVYSGTVNASDLNGKTLHPIDGCLPPSHLTATDIITTTATLTWTETGEATTWQICLNGDENNPITIDTEDVAINEGVITYQLTGLIPGTAYTVKVRANCDADDVSLWSNIATFTTLNPCEVLPSELAATNSTATTATLSWSGVQDSYNVRYRPAGGEDFNFFEGFEGCDNWTLPEGWTTVLEEDFGGWSACNNCYDIEAYNGNNYAIDYNDHAWLITPMMDLSGQSNVTLNFWYIDKGQFEVYYRINGGDWIQTPLWSSEGSHTQWTEATISLTENLSANYQIGFFISEGTPVFLDDIAITVTSLHPVGEWQTVNSIAATTTTLTGLTPETSYQWQVQGLNCDGEGSTTEWSEMGTFTTPDPCEAPIGLTATDITATTATLSWSGVQDSYAVQYRTADVVANTLLTEDFERYEFTDFPEGWNNNNWNVNSYYHHSGEKSVETNNSDSYLITPVLEISENANVVINFWYITEQYGEATPQLEVYYRPADHPVDWMPLWSSEGSHPDWTEASIAVEDCGNIQLVFMVSCSQSFAVYLDDITVTSYTGYGEWQTIDGIAATTTTLTGLTPEMPYQWQVRGISEYCPYAHPDWSTMGTFTTNSVLELADNDAEKPVGEKNADLISGDDGTAKDVMLAGRTLWKDGAWNTLCLPFSMNAGQVTAQLEPTELKELDTEHKWANVDGKWTVSENGQMTGLDNGTLYLNFKDADAISAGVPYIIKWASGSNIVDPVFSDVTIVKSAPTAVTFTGGKFVGTYNYTKYTNENKSILLLGEDNTLYYPQPARENPDDETSAMVYPSIGAFRAYFQLDDPASVRAFKLNFGDGEQEAQGIKEIEDGRLKIENEAGAWYSLDGVKLDGQPTKKGLYIHEGRKVVIK